jgi:transcription elongation factor Elf1
LLAERAETCPECGHPKSVCRDRKTAGTWTVVEEVCQPSVVAQVKAEQIHEAKQRGRVIMTRRT